MTNGINYGQFSEALNNKADIDLRNIDTNKCDMVIEYQEPTAENNYTWYRLYATGWVEQGGFTNVAQSEVTETISLPVTMQNNHYQVTINYQSNDNQSNVQYAKISAWDKTVIDFKMLSSAYYKSWQVYGLADMTGHEILPAVAEHEEFEHRVVLFQKPTAENNYTWYRKYADGWVEQGGKVLTTTVGAQVNLPVTMLDTNYIINAHGTSSVTSQPSDTATANRNTSFNYNRLAYDIKTTGFKVGNESEMGQNGFCWEVKGMAA